MQGRLAQEIRVGTSSHLPLGVHLPGAIDDPATVECLHAGMQGPAQGVEVRIALRSHLGTGRVHCPTCRQSIVRVLDHCCLDRERAPCRATGIARTTGVCGQGLAAVRQQAGNHSPQDVVLVAADETIGIGLAQQVTVGVVVRPADAVPPRIALADREQVQVRVIGSGHRRFGDLLRRVGAEICPQRFAGDVAPDIPGVAGHHSEIRIAGLRDLLRHGPGRTVVDQLRLGDQH
ncbi:hypothetical protein D3C78_574010 [compost metagenome]